MNRPGRSRGLLLVLAAAAGLRAVFILWGLGGAGLGTGYGIGVRDFVSGYAIAAGYGYITGTGPALDHMRRLHASISEGSLAVSPGSYGPLPAETAWPEIIHPPGLPLLVAGAHRLFGGAADLPIQVLGLLLDTAAAGLVWWIAGFLFARPVPVVAGLLYALFPPLAYWTTVAQTSEGLMTVIVAGSVAALLRSTGHEGRAAIGWEAASGLALGLGSYLRPDYVLLPVVFGAGLMAARVGWRRAARAALLVQVTLLLTLVPWAARNHRVCGRWIFTSSSVGATLISGLGGFKNPWGFGPSDEDRNAQARAIGLPSAFVPEADVYFRGLFWRSVREHPGAYAMSVVKRLPFAVATPYWFGFENPWKSGTLTEARQGTEDRYDVIRRRPLYILAAYGDTLLMALVALAATLSIVVLFVKERRRWGWLLIVVGPHLYSVATHLLTFFEPRYLIPSLFGPLIALAYVVCRGRQGPGERPSASAA
jgi:hypothetical protein